MLLTEVKKMNVQGSALLFYYNGICRKGREPFSKVPLQVEVLKERNLTPRQCSGCYIENTNLHNLPCNGLGVLVAYSTDINNKRHESKWYLGVIILLHPTSTIISPTINVSDGFHHSSSTDVFQHRNTFKMIYLNKIHHKMLSNDGFIESLPTGPDVIFSLQSLSNNNLINQYNDGRSKIKQFYRLLSPSCYRRVRNPFIKCSKVMRLNNQNTVVSDTIKTVYVKKKNS